MHQEPTPQIFLNFLVLVGTKTCVAASAMGLYCHVLLLKGRQCEKGWPVGEGIVRRWRIHCEGSVADEFFGEEIEEGKKLVVTGNWNHLHVASRFSVHSTIFGLFDQVRKQAAMPLAVMSETLDTE